MIDHRRLLVYFDWPLFGAIGLLSLIGLAMVYSATYDPATGEAGPQVLRQAVAFAIGFAALFACLLVDYRTLAERSLLLYGGLVAALVATLFVGVEQGGAQRWLDLGVATIQPSEFARVVLALVLATLLVRSRQIRRHWADWLVAGAIVGVPVVLIMRQPDLGTAATLLPVGLAVMLLAGMRLRLLAVVAVLAILAAPVVWAYGLEDYQRTRVASFLDPEQDPRGAGYQQIQARITVGAGGLTGRGFLEGTQSQYNFVPAAHTDFIFSVLAEEHGFLGVVVTLGLYLFVILRSFQVARVVEDRLGVLLVAGIMAGFTFQVVYNVSMSAGLLPVKGLTLPLLSYGRSSLIATLIGFGLILNVRMYRFSKF